MFVCISGLGPRVAFNGLTLNPITPFNNTSDYRELNFDTTGNSLRIRRKYERLCALLNHSERNRRNVDKSTIRRGGAKYKEKPHLKQTRRP